MVKKRSTSYTNSSCPSPRELHALLREQLEGEVEQAIHTHLEICDACRQSLEAAAGEPSWWRESESFLRDVRESRLGRRPGAAAKVDEERTACMDESGPHASLLDEIQNWLVPSDDPASMGRIGHFEITGVIGAGSMGVVLKAHEPRLRRNVALKILLPLLAHNGAARQRFSREARAAAAVNHPHVVPIHGVDEHRGLPYLVMQYVPGQSLAQRIARQGPLSPEEVVRVALQTARGLAAAHEQGLVHRDVKPANILLDNGTERVLVTDFGLARIADDSSMTRSGVITGTPEFMSPEQAGGHPVDARGDLFSLGAVMYAACTGHSPFRARTVFGVLQRIREDQPRSIRDCNPKIPRWLEQFVDRLLAKDAAARFSTAAEVASYLAEELAHLQNPISSPRPARGWLPRPRRRRLWVGTMTVCCAAFLAIASGLGGFAWLRPSSMPPEVLRDTFTREAPGRNPAGAQAGSPEPDIGDALRRADASRRRNDTPFAAWTDEHGTLQQVLADLQRLEAAYWSASPAVVQDPWAEESSELRQALERLEAEYDLARETSL